MKIDAESGGVFYMYYPELKEYQVWYGSMIRLPGDSFVTCFSLREALDQMMAWCLMMAEQHQAEEKAKVKA